MNWDTLIRQFANYLRLERSLSDNSIQAYVRDVAKLKQFVDNSNLDLSPTADYHGGDTRLSEIPP